MSLLSEEQVADFVSRHGEWRHDGVSIVRDFEFEDFVEAMGFVASVALVAEKAFHHPDIDIRWNTVTLRLSTHSEGGLTAQDTELAERIETLV